MIPLPEIHKYCDECGREIRATDYLGLCGPCYQSMKQMYAENENAAHSHQEENNDRTDYH